MSTAATLGCVAQPDSTDSMKDKLLGAEGLPPSVCVTGTTPLRVVALRRDAGKRDATRRPRLHTPDTRNRKRARGCDSNTHRAACAYAGCAGGAVGG
jgi:hypothetical protein